MNLFWVTTIDHGEDWFVIANDAREAAQFHEDVEGYDPGDAMAEMILEIPEGITVDVGWPSDEVLQTCGARIVTGPPTRIVKIGDRTFCEGLMESEIRAVDEMIREILEEDDPDESSEITKH